MRHHWALMRIGMIFGTAFVIAILGTLFIGRPAIVPEQQFPTVVSPPSGQLPITSPPVTIPVTPSPTSPPAVAVTYGKYGYGSCTSDARCVPAGCSAQVCSSDPTLITTCEYRSDFPDKTQWRCGCYQQKCEWIRK